MGSATYPILGSKIPDYRRTPGAGEKMYVRGGAAAFGDVKMAGLFVTDAAITATDIMASSDSLLANVVPVAAGTSNVNLRLADFRVCNETAGVVDDKQGAFLGETRCFARVKVTTAGGSFATGTPFVATDAQVHLTQASLAVNNFKIVAILAGTQTLAAGVDIAEVIFDGVHGFGPN